MAEPLRIHSETMAGEATRLLADAEHKLGQALQRASPEAECRVGSTVMADDVGVEVESA